MPGGAPIGRDEWAVRVREWCPELVDAKAPLVTYPDINRLRHVIEPMLDDVTVATAFQRCRAEHGLTAGVTAFRQYVRLEFPTGPRAESVTLWRPPVPPGVGVRDGVGVQPPRRAGSTPPTSTIYPGQGILFAALTRV